MSFHRTIFLIGGLPSTGSTLLASQLSTYNDIFIGPELGLFSHPALWSNFSVYKEYAFSTNLFIDFEQDSQQLLLQKGIIYFSQTTDEHLSWYGINRSQVLQAIRDSDDSGTFISILRSLIGIPDDRYWFEKTPQNILSIASYIQQDPTSHYALVCTRDLLDVIISYSRRSADLDWVYEYLIISLSSYFHLVRQYPSNISSVRYEQLVANPRQCITSCLSIFPLNVPRVLKATDSPTSPYKATFNPVRTEVPSTWSRLPSDPGQVVKHSFLHYIASYSWRSGIIKTIKLINVISYLLRYAKLENTFLKRNSSYLLYPCSLSTFTVVVSYLIASLTCRMAHLSPSPVFIQSHIPLNINIPKSLLIIIIFFFGIFKKLLTFCFASFRNLLKSLQSLFTCIQHKLLDYAKQAYLLYIAYLAPSLGNLRYLLLSKSYALQLKVNLSHSAYESDLAICCATDGRLSLIELQCDEIQQAIICSNLRIKYIITVSSASDLCFLTRLTSRYDFIHINLAINRPLGYKWQECVTFAKQTANPYALMITGSDDLVSAQYIINSFRQVSVSGLPKIPVVMPMYWSMYDVKTSESYQLSYVPTQKIPLGAGRVFPRPFLDLLNWRLFDTSLNSQLDNKAYYNLYRVRCFFQGFSLYYEQGLLLSIKNADKLALNPIDTILSASTIEYRKLDQKQASLSDCFLSPLVKKLFLSTGND